MLNFKLFLEQLDRPLVTQELGLPSVSKTSTVSYLERNKNPIFILLADGTKLYLSWDEFNRVEGCEPEVGKKMTVIFQRHPSNKTEATSQIERLICSNIESTRQSTIAKTNNWKDYVGHKNLSLTI